MSDVTIELSTTNVEPSRPAPKGDIGTSSAIESGQSLMADHAPHTARRPYKRGESKADIAVARHELMRENIRLQNELAAARNELDTRTIDRDMVRGACERAAIEVVALRAEVALLRAARCRWCPAKWWRSKA